MNPKRFVIPIESSTSAFRLSVTHSSTSSTLLFSRMNHFSEQKKDWFHCQTFPDNLWKTKLKNKKKKVVTQNRAEQRVFIGNLHNIHPPSWTFNSLPFFMQKGYKWIERESNLLIFSSMLFYRSTSIHLSQYSTQIKHVYAVLNEEEWGMRRERDLHL